MKTKLQSMGFSIAHAQLIGIAVVVFAVLVFTQTGISIKGMFAKAEIQPVVITYEQARTEVLNEQSVSSNNVSEDLNQRQLALLNRTDENGQVLGSAIGIGDIPTADQIFSREQLDLIVINTVATNPKNILKYSEQIMAIESENNALALLGNLNSSDPVALSEASKQATVLVSNFKSLSVPSELADYHRYKMIYYQSLARIAQAFEKNELNDDFANTSKILFSIMDKIEQTKRLVSEKYQVAL
ncbi:MAG: hypothetical protein M3Q64_01205 [bacterium]|nr:hypothetical protein [bacterium]